MSEQETKDPPSCNNCKQYNICRILATLNDMRLAWIDKTNDYNNSISYLVPKVIAERCKNYSECKE